MSVDEPETKLRPAAANASWDFPAAIDLIRFQTAHLAAQVAAGPLATGAAFEKECGILQQANGKEPSLGDLAKVFSLLGLELAPKELVPSTRPTKALGRKARASDRVDGKDLDRIAKRARKTTSKKNQKHATGRNARGKENIASGDEGAVLTPASFVAATNVEIYDSSNATVETAQGATLLPSVLDIHPEGTVHFHTDSEYYDGLRTRSSALRRVSGRKSLHGIAPRVQVLSEEAPLPRTASSATASVKKTAGGRRDIIQSIIGLPEPKEKTASETQASSAVGVLRRRKSASDSTFSQAWSERAAEMNAKRRADLMRILFGTPSKAAMAPAFLPSSLRPLELQLTSNKIHVFVDLSNILIGFKDTLKARSEAGHTPRATISFSQLALLLERNRPAAKRVLAGSDTFSCVTEAEQLGYETNILARVSKERPRGRHSGSESDTDGRGRARKMEQAVDEVLHLKMLESVVDCEAPATMVLATGDAAAAEYSPGFLSMVERALRRGWSVEVAAFSVNRSSAWRRPAWTQSWQGRFTDVELDAFAELLVREG